MAPPAPPSTISAAGCSGATRASRLSGRSPSAPSTPRGCSTGQVGGYPHGSPRLTAGRGRRRPRCRAPWPPRTPSPRSGRAWPEALSGHGGRSSPTSGPASPSGRSPGWSTPGCGRARPRRSTAPASPLQSGCPESLLPFADLGQQGRRYVTDVVTPELIEEVMGEPAVAHPIRTYVGFNSEPLYQTGRAELALAELDRAGAFDRSHLLLISPTGTGWVDQTLIEAAEFLTRGDIATCCIQYGRYPSFLSVQKVALGQGQFRLLLWGVTQRLAGMPPERRPRVLVFGESMGAWTSSDVIMFQGIKGFDHCGIDRALWVGLPWLAKWSRSGMTRGSSTLVPEGTVGVFDHHEQLQELSEEQRERLRAVVVSNDNDPIAVLGPELLIKPPWWLADGQRGRGVPDAMHWRPLITFIQTAMDAANAMLLTPGEFASFGHDY